VVASEPVSSSCNEEVNGRSWAIDGVSGLQGLEEKLVTGGASRVSHSCFMSGKSENEAGRSGKTGDEPVSQFEEDCTESRTARPRSRYSKAYSSEACKRASSLPRLPPG
jgi:hypothetical protein